MDRPTEGFQRSVLFDVPLDVPCKFRSPVIGITRWDASILAACMLVPEATVNHDDCLVLGKDDVRLSRQVLSVKPEPESERMKGAPHKEFWLGILVLDAAHDLAAFLGRYKIGHDAGMLLYARL